MMARRGGTVSVVDPPHVAGEVVERRLDGAAGLELGDVPDHQVGLERVGMVLVERGAILEPQIEPVAVVAIVIEDRDRVGPERLDDAADDGGLAGAGPAGDADDQPALLWLWPIRRLAPLLQPLRLVPATLALYMDAEGKVMSPRFIAWPRRRPGASPSATALAASLGLATLAAADEQVTALLRNGERVTGRFDGFTNNQVYIDVSATDERKIPVGDVALLDLVGAAQGLPETELRQARGDDHVLLLKAAARSRVGSSIEARSGTRRPADPTLRVPDDARARSGGCALAEVGRLYLGRYPGAAPAESTTAATPRPPAPERRGHRRRQPAWVSTRHHRRQGPAGQLRARPVKCSSARTAPTSPPRRARRSVAVLSAGPLPGQLAGALIGRVGNGQVFGIGNQAGPLSMPDAGLLYLGVNDDNVDDNRGAFTVTVTALPVTTSPTAARGRIRAAVARCSWACRRHALRAPRAPSERAAGSRVQCAGAMPEWKDTVNLPRTDFPMRANLPTTEPQVLARWEADGLYARIRERRAGAPRASSCTTARRTPTATSTSAPPSTRSSRTSSSSRGRWPASTRPTCRAGTATACRSS